MLRTVLLRGPLYGPRIGECDTVALKTGEAVVFAKNSDRPVSEIQMLEAFEPLNSGQIRTTYLTIPAAERRRGLGSRPTWMWGFEHGINDAGVAIGNEKVFTRTDPYEVGAALTGMDLVRLALQRADSAKEAVLTMGSLLEEYGQGGIADRAANEPYFSSFLIADPHEIWVMETDADSWVARRVRERGGAISNRLILKDDFDLCSSDLEPGFNWDSQRHPEAPTGHADVRLKKSAACLTGIPENIAAIEAAGYLASLLRNHGGQFWGNPFKEDSEVELPPQMAFPDGTGVSVCMHIRFYQATTASQIAILREGEAPFAFFSMGNPCCSILVPARIGEVAPCLLDEKSFHVFSRASRAVEEVGELLYEIREVVAGVEKRLWQHAASVLSNEEKHLDVELIERSMRGALSDLDSLLKARGF